MLVRRPHDLTIGPYIIQATSLREALIPPADVAKVSLADELSPDDPENILVKLCEIGDR